MGRYVGKGCLSTPHHRGTLRLRWGYGLGLSRDSAEKPGRCCKHRPIFLHSANVTWIILLALGPVYQKFHEIPLMVRDFQ